MPLVIDHVAIDRVFLSPANPRVNEGGVDHVAASIRRFGWQQPIVAKRSGEVIAGNTRLKAARVLELDEVPVIWFDGEELEALAYQVADNRTHEFSEWDEEALATVLKALQAEDGGLDGVGFEDADIDGLIASLAEENEGEPEVPALPEDPVSRLGDLWMLGEHRLLCGSSTSREDVERLLAGARPGLMVTDPPYGVAYDPTWRHRAGVNKSGRVGAVENDDVADWTAAWELFSGDVAYVWHAALHAPTVLASLESVGFVPRAQIVWAKPALVMGRGHYHWQHEPCWYAVRKGASASWIGDRSQSTLWEIGRDEDQETVHGTQKPLECMARAIRNHSGSVYEPFSGSGTTIIAAQQLGRACFAMEISPGYVDVAVRRWEAATGASATLGADGPTFDQVAAGRCASG